jgi:hypothetical protein
MEVLPFLLSFLTYFPEFCYSVGGLLVLNKSYLYSCLDIRIKKG